MQSPHNLSSFKQYQKFMLTQYSVRVTKNYDDGMTCSLCGKTIPIKEFVYAVQEGDRILKLCNSCFQEYPLGDESAAAKQNTKQKQDVTIKFPTGKNENHIVEWIPIDKIKDPLITREDTDRSYLEASIKSHGILDPIIVRDLGGGKYRVISGHGRLITARKLGLEKIQARVIRCNDVVEVILALEANEVRKPLSVADRYKYIKFLKDHRVSNEEILKKVKISESTLYRLLWLSEYPEELRKMFLREEIPLRGSDYVHQIQKLKPELLPRLPQHLSKVNAEQRIKILSQIVKDLKKEEEQKQQRLIQEETPEPELKEDEDLKRVRELQALWGKVSEQVKNIFEYNDQFGPFFINKMEHASDVLFLTRHEQASEALKQLKELFETENVSNLIQRVRKTDIPRTAPMVTACIFRAKQKAATYDFLGYVATKLSDVILELYIWEDKQTWYEKCNLILKAFEKESFPAGKNELEEEPIDKDLPCCANCAKYPDCGNKPGGLNPQPTLSCSEFESKWTQNQNQKIADQYVLAKKVQVFFENEILSCNLPQEVRDEIVYYYNQIMTLLEGIEYDKKF